LDDFLIGDKKSGVVLRQSYSPSFLDQAEVVDSPQHPQSHSAPQQLQLQFIHFTSVSYVTYQR